MVFVAVQVFFPSGVHRYEIDPTMEVDWPLMIRPLFGDVEDMLRANDIHTAEVWFHYFEEIPENPIFVLASPRKTEIAH
ncbi:hypothetical protein Y032_0052g2213 [Ancylostoma ceylanicum]|uniref:Uncharacterized protein n=1 Tax=Ancylostoma ceylanicum TaxID=53326 RepID=A0A016U865_9BILA|nr:hypothetical protein Y032_0052g2213 [Ancylostoma ceylanicum]